MEPYFCRDYQCSLKGERRERKRVPFHTGAETGIPICTKDRNNTWNSNTNPIPSYEVSLFCYQFSCLRIQFS
ncbi:hypothetical protein VNO80_02738 [Phaseolus coccineus]|uniref:Uncharacterized protein n=1 Tax=Phaseolus coccineus TaxID=3886 RepID=A0AAN9RI75_PHACN